MTRIRLKSAPRKTSVSRARVRSIMSRLYKETKAASEKPSSKTRAAKIPARKTVTRKPVYRKAG